MMSALRNQPSSVNASSVAPGRSRYPGATFGPLTWSSPISPSAALRRSASMTESSSRTSTFSSGGPSVPARESSGGLTETTGDVSVSPYPS